MNSAKLIDHTLLKPESTRTQIDQIIDEAKAYNLAGATRIGASAGVQIMQGLEADSDY